MAKKLVAKTGIKYGNDNADGMINEGDEVDTSKFSREQLKELYDAGAVGIEGEDDPTVGPNTQVQAPGKVGTDEGKDAGSVNKPDLSETGGAVAGSDTPAAGVNKGKTDSKNQK